MLSSVDRSLLYANIVPDTLILSFCSDLLAVFLFELSDNRQ